MKCVNSSYKSRSTGKSKKISEEHIKNHINLLLDQIEKKDKMIERLWSLLENENIENDITKNWIIHK